MTEAQVITIGAILVVIGLVLTHVAFSRLKALEFDIWKRLGQPHLILNNTPAHAVRWMRFLYKGEYNGVPDTFLRLLLRSLALINAAVVIWLLFVLYAIFA